MKKVFGYIFIVTAVIMAIAAIGLWAEVFKAIGGMVKLFSGKLDSYNAGSAMGGFIFWLLFFLILVALLNFGTKWIKK